MESTIAVICTHSALDFPLSRHSIPITGRTVSTSARQGTKNSRKKLRSQPRKVTNWPHSIFLDHRKGSEKISDNVIDRQTHTHTHTRLTALCPGLPARAGTRKAEPIWILLKQETLSGSSISWAICKSAPRSRQITMPAPHCSVFYRPDALPETQPTASKHCFTGTSAEVSVVIVALSRQVCAVWQNSCRCHFFNLQRLNGTGKGQTKTRNYENGNETRN